MEWGMLMGRKTYVLHSDEDTAVVITRLQKVCDTRKPTGFYEYPPDVLFVGSIGTSSFVITPVNFRRNAALPRIGGGVYKKGGGTEIVLTVCPDAYLPMVVLIVAVAAAILLQIRDSTLSMASLLLAMVMPVILLLLMRQQAEKAVERLRIALGLQ